MKWSDTDLSLCTPFQLTGMCFWVASGLRPQSSLNPATLHSLLSPPLNTSLSASQPFRLYKFSSVRLTLPVRADKVQMKQICHLLRFALQSTDKFGIDSSCLLECFKCDFCLCDKCIIAPYFNYTKAFFVWFKPPFPSLLFDDSVLYYVRDFNE